MNWRANVERARRLSAALLILAIAGLAGVLPVAAERANGAGLVVRLEDDSVIYAYVEFAEDEITSEELLYRSGLDVVVAPFGGLGVAVCSIEGTGCPADNCFCKSYTAPAVFWHFYATEQGAWIEQLIGPSSRAIRDGDVDGWSWTAGDAGLPSVTIDDIAAMNGIDRNLPNPTETPTPPEPTLAPTDTPAPPAPPQPTETATAVDPPATNTAMAPEPSATESGATMTSAPTMGPTATSAPGTTSASTIRDATPSPIRKPTATATDPPAMTPAPTLTVTAAATTAAVLVRPDGTPVPLEIVRADNGSSSSGYVIFGLMAGLVVAAGTIAALRGRRDAGA